MRWPAREARSNGDRRRGGVHGPHQREEAAEPDAASTRPEVDRERRPAGSVNEHDAERDRGEEATAASREARRITRRPLARWAARSDAPLLLGEQLGRAQLVADALECGDRVVLHLGRHIMLGELCPFEESGQAARRRRGSPRGSPRMRSRYSSGASGGGAREAERCERPLEPRVGGDHGAARIRLGAEVVERLVQRGRRGRATRGSEAGGGSPARAVRHGRTSRQRSRAAEHDQPGRSRTRARSLGRGAGYVRVAVGRGRGGRPVRRSSAPRSRSAADPAAMKRARIPKRDRGCDHCVAAGASASVGHGLGPSIPLRWASRRTSRIAADAIKSRIEHEQHVEEAVGRTASARRLRPEPIRSGPRRRRPEQAREHEQAERGARRGSSRVELASTSG